MITMEPMSTTVSDETLHILRRFYPPPDDLADKLLYEGEQYVRLYSRCPSRYMEKRMEPVGDWDRGHVCDTPTEKDQETISEIDSVAVSR